MPTQPSTQRNHLIIRSTVVSFCVNLTLAIAKIVLGIFTHAQVLIADGIHSISDLITDVAIFVTNHFASRQPDQDHPYGHQRIETAASILLALILIGVSIGLLFDSYHNWSHYLEMTRPHLVSAIALISIIANELLYRYIHHIANLTHSQLLEANAWHNRSDAFVSCIVLVAAIGDYFHIHSLNIIGTLLIAGLIAHMGYKILMKSFKELVDTGVNSELEDTITQMVQTVPGVLSLHQLRSRSHASFFFLDLHILVEPYISVSEGHYISELVSQTLVTNIDCIRDVTVHIDSEDDSQHTQLLTLPTRTALLQALTQQWCALPSFDHIDQVLLHYLNDTIDIDLYFTGLPPDHQALLSQYQQAVTALPIRHLSFFYSLSPTNTRLPPPFKPSK